MLTIKKCRTLVEVNNLIRRLYYEGNCTWWKVNVEVTVETPYFIVKYETEE